MCPSLIRIWLLLPVLTRYTVQHGQEILDSLAELKIPIMARYKIMIRYGRANLYSVQPQPLVFRPAPQPRQNEEVYPADGARAEQWHAHGDGTRRRREWEEEELRTMMEHHRIEQDEILRKQREVDLAAQAMRRRQSTGQNQAVTITPVTPSSSVQYPSQMPLESPTRFVTHKLVHALLIIKKLNTLLNTDLVPKSPINRESRSSLGYAGSIVDMFYPSFSPIQPTTITSPLPPQLGTIQYPSLMSQHQISQGYDPSPTGQLPRGFVPRDVLKTVSFPRECLNRFISIALLNTARDQETCGLLLGKDKGGRYVVTTLLIPKQHATRGTCTIDDEELVMQFTEKRSLITLGWVRLHIFWWIRAHSSGCYC